MHAPVTRSRGEEQRAGLLLVAGMVALMWAVEVADAIANGRLDAQGIRPRAVDGLDGILWSPFLHGSWGHLVGNTIPFLILGAVIALSGLARVAMVTVIVALVGGFGTWLIAPENTVHIGASGLVFGFAAYLVARGFYTRSLLHLAAGALVAVVFGTTLLWGLVPREGISWQGHLFGAIGGIVAARALSAKAAEKPAPRDPLAALR
jgi:membrane associated rhomboid family serine protease